MMASMRSFQSQVKGLAILTCLLHEAIAQSSTADLAPSASVPNSPVTPPGPYFVSGQGNFAGLSDEGADFKEVDYIGTQAERQRYIEADDFLFDFPAQEGKTTVGKGGSSLQLDVNNKPTLVRSNAMSQTVFTLAPCGLNVPHLHPRAAKVVFVLQGAINIGFVEENGGRSIGMNVSAGQSYVIPQGLVMWIHNLQCEEAKYLDTWSNNDPGILNLVEALFKMPLPTVATALGISTSDAQALMARPLSAVEQGPDECMARCNMTGDVTRLQSPRAAPVAILQSGR